MVLAMPCRTCAACKALFAPALSLSCRMMMSRPVSGLWQSFAHLPDATVWHKADISRLSSNVRFRG